MTRIALLISLCAFSSSTFAWSISCNRSGKSQYCYSWFTSQNRATGEKKRYKINFNISDNRVDTRSVCSEQKYGSIDSITCKREAYSLFKRACQTDRDTASLRYQQQRMYCDAYNRFVPSR